MSYEVVIGVEVHAQLRTKSKMFCGCGTTFGLSANSQTCPVCLGLPGTLPVINKAAVEMAVRAGLALNCTIGTDNRFARKNYFYPDLPKGYQISQYESPICEHGWIEIAAGDGTKRVRIRRAHLEEDAGKNVHETGTSGSRVDLSGWRFTAGISYRFPTNTSIPANVWFVSHVKVVETAPPCHTPFADFDQDSDVDQIDFAAFQACYTGQGGMVTGDCLCFDRVDPGQTQSDGDIDQTDRAPAGRFPASQTCRSSLLR